MKYGRGCKEWCGVNDKSKDTVWEGILDRVGSWEGRKS